ncbi:hypothetical protein Ae201684P_003194 [Aphanomyces euteiches]|nr:hypothetical protein Ae201684P_003194 [Aphanomyces euteiches]
MESSSAPLELTPHVVLTVVTTRFVPLVAPRDVGCNLLGICLCARSATTCCAHPPLSNSILVVWRPLFWSISASALLVLAMEKTLATVQASNFRGGEIAFWNGCDRYNAGDRCRASSPHRALLPTAVVTAAKWDAIDVKRDENLKPLAATTSVDDCQV